MIALAPFHKKLVIKDGPFEIVGKEFFDDGSDVFETRVEAINHAYKLIREGFEKFNKLIGHGTLQMMGPM